MRSYAELIANVRTVIEAHNQVVGGEGNDGFVNIEDFLAKLRANGGTTEAGLKLAKFEHLEQWGLPPLLAQQVAGIFRGTDSGSEGEKKKGGNVSVFNASSKSDRDLLIAYDPNMPTSPAAQELEKRSGGKAFIQFNGDDAANGVNIDASVANLQALKQTIDVPERVLVGTVWETVLHVGQVPAEVANEHPLYPGKALRGWSCMLNLDWSSLTEEARQMLHLAVKSEELTITGNNDVVEAFGYAKDVAMLHHRFPKAAAKYTELKKTQQLPTLKVTVERRPVGAGAKTTRWQS